MMRPGTANARVPGWAIPISTPKGSANGDTTPFNRVPSGIEYARCMSDVLIL